MKKRGKERKKGEGGKSEIERIQLKERRERKRQETSGIIKR